MQTIKTGVVVALLLAVCYGAFKALNAPDPELPESIQEWIASGDGETLEQLDLGIAPGDLASLDNAEAISPEKLFSIDNGEAVPELPGNPMRSGNAGAALPEIPSLGSNAGEAALGELPVVSDFNFGNSQASPSAEMQAKTPDAESGGTANLPDLKVPDLPSMSTAANSENADMQVSLPALPGMQASSQEVATAAAGKTTDLQAEFDKMLEESKQIAASDSPSVGSLAENLDSAADSGEPAAPAAQSNPSPGSLVSNTKEVSEPKAPALTKQPTAKFSVAREQTLALANRGELKEALALLTPYFDSPELTYEQSQDMMEILDALARAVIYSQRHLVQPPHVAKATDTVASVAKQYNINPELLNALNGLGDAKALVPGTELKVVQGPFNAQVDLKKKELILFVDQLYAGRFPFSIGSDPQPTAGAFEVVDRQTNRTYYGMGAVVLQHNDPRNPYGGFWLNLGHDLCIHGSPQMPSPDLKEAGCISLAPRDAEHVFSILTVGSHVRITE